MEAHPPKHVDILVIGGGPSGSFAASVLAREGMEVAIFESATFPRYHIGESLIPSIRPYLRFIDAEQKVLAHGFTPKPGAACKFSQYKHEGYTDFIAVGYGNAAWNVVRSEFDHLLMDHARSQGAVVCERTRVNSVEFDTNDKATAVTWTFVPKDFSLPRVTGKTTFSYLIDASGRAGIISTRYLKNRRYSESLRNIAVWGYWSGAGTYVGTDPIAHPERKGAPWFEALTDESGWAWFIPLHNGTTSVGVVMNQKRYNESRDAHTDLSPVERYKAQVALAPGLMKLVGKGTLVSAPVERDAPANGPEAQVKTASDFSYSASSYAGNGFRISGDAGCFIDPFFSSGVHLAMTSALSAAATICAVKRGGCTEEQAAKWHSIRVATSYTRFQVVVMSAYRQMLSQNECILADIDEENYDRAFSIVRPLIQGAADVGCRLSEDELQRSLDFCVHVFAPTSPAQHVKVAQKGFEELLDVTAPILAKGEAMVVDEETDLVVREVNARKIVHPEFTTNNLEAELLDGFAIRWEHGNLGLMRK